MKLFVGGNYLRELEQRYRCLLRLLRLLRLLLLLLLLHWFSDLLDGIKLESK